MAEKWRFPFDKEDMEKLSSSNKSEAKAALKKYLLHEAESASKIGITPDDDTIWWLFGNKLEGIQESLEKKKKPHRAALSNGLIEAASNLLQDISAQSLSEEKLSYALQFQDLAQKLLIEPKEVQFKSYIDDIQIKIFIEALIKSGGNANAVYRLINRVTGKKIATIKALHNNDTVQLPLSCLAYKEFVKASAPTLLDIFYEAIDWVPPKIITGNNERYDRETLNAYYSLRGELLSCLSVIFDNPEDPQAVKMDNPYTHDSLSCWNMAIKTLKIREAHKDGYPQGNH